MIWRKRTYAGKPGEPYVNMMDMGPFGLRITRDFPSIAAAKAVRLPGERTVRRNLALAWMAEKARDPKYWETIHRIAEEGRTAQEERAVLRARAQADTQPVLAMADLPRKAWDLLAKARLALAGLGHVRPHQFSTGGYSTQQVMVVLTQHEIDTLLTMREASERYGHLAHQSLPLPTWAARS